MNQRSAGFYASALTRASQSDAGVILREAKDLKRRVSLACLSALSAISVFNQPRNFRMDRMQGHSERVFRSEESFFSFYFSTIPLFYLYTRLLRSHHSGKLMRIVVKSREDRRQIFHS